MSGMGGAPIVVGFDGSDAARTGAVWAAGQAVRSRVELRLVHVINMSAFAFAGGYAPPPDFFAAVESAEHARLGGVRKEIHRSYPELLVKIELRSGHPVSALVGESRRASLLVVGARGQTAAPSCFVGATAVGVAARAECPTAVIHDGPSARAAIGAVVVGVDGSPAGESAVEFAFEEASARRAELVAVYGWSECTSDNEYAYARRFILDWRGIEAQEHRALAERLAGWHEKYPDVVVRRIVVRQNAAQLLLSQASGAQLMVVGSRGRGGFTGMLLGSVSQTLIRYVPCPLIIARLGFTG